MIFQIKLLGEMFFDDHQWYSTFCTSIVDSYLASQLVGIFEKRQIKTGAIVFRSWGNSCTFLFQLSISRILHSNYSLHAYSSCLSVKLRTREASISFIPTKWFHHKNQIWGNSSSFSSWIYPCMLIKSKLGANFTPFNLSNVPQSPQNKGAITYP